METEDIKASLSAQLVRAVVLIVLGSQDWFIKLEFPLSITHNCSAFFPLFTFFSFLFHSRKGSRPRLRKTQLGYVAKTRVPFPLDVHFSGLHGIRCLENISSLNIRFIVHHNFEPLTYVS